MSRAGSDLTGQTFSHLTAVAPVGRTKEGVVIWRCRCACGNDTEVRRGNLVTGHTTNCGCVRVAKLVAMRTKLRTKSGVCSSRSPEYRAWIDMKLRCYNQNKHGFHNWGGRGISVCAEWIYDFAAFYTHIGPRPSPKYSLDRIDNGGNYEPGNVKWSTRREQNANSRDKGPAVSAALKRYHQERRDVADA